MKKGIKLLSTVLLAGGTVALLIAGFTASDTSLKLSAQAPATRPENMNCQYYWQDVKYGFRDLYSTIKTKIDDASSTPGIQKELDLYTWGTITSKWLNDNNEVCMIIQSKNSSGNDGAIQLTNCVQSLSTFSVGNVVEVKYYPSSVTLGDGQLPQIGPLSQNNRETEVYLAYETNPAPVTVYNANRDFTFGYSLSTAYHGLIKCYLEKFTIKSIDERECLAEITIGKSSVSIDYSGLNATEEAAIYTALNDAMTNEYAISATGHKFAYYEDRDNNGLRLYLRSASDISI